MKKVVVGCCLLMCIQTVQGQLWVEFFRQKETQKKYLLQQIAALATYADYVREGYQIAQEGLTFINDVKTGQFSLDKNYFASFQQVNPALKGLAKLDSMNTMKEMIVRLRQSCMRYCAQSPSYQQTDIDLVRSIFEDLLTQYDAVYRDMTLVNTSSAIAMSDHERGKKMSELFAEAKAIYGYARKFDRSTRLYGIQVQREKASIQSLAQWYGIN